MYICSAWNLRWGLWSGATNRPMFWSLSFGRAARRDGLRMMLVDENQRFVASHHITSHLVAAVLDLTGSAIHEDMVTLCCIWIVLVLSLLFIRPILHLEQSISFDTCSPFQIIRFIQWWKWDTSSNNWRFPQPLNISKWFNIYLVSTAAQDWTICKKGFVQWLSRTLRYSHHWHCSTLKWSWFHILTRSGTVLLEACLETVWAIASLRSCVCFIKTRVGSPSRSSLWPSQRTKGNP